MNLTSFKIVAAVFAMAAVVAEAQTSVPPINLASAGTPFSEGVRGQAIPSITQTRPPATIGTQMSLAVSKDSSIRGVAGGLEADFYDWRNRNNDARSTTLEYLRFARDNNAKLVITANIRGLAEPDPTTPATTDLRFYDTSIGTLTQMAADWVRYTNVIAQSYRQGDTITNPQDQAILNSLVWTTGPTDTHAKLPTPSEAPLPKVTYWEIGNEPRVGLASTYNFTNSYTFLTPSHPVDSTHKYDYRERYASLAAAMKAVDPTIKVGPALQWLNSVSERELLNSILNPQPGGGYLPVDFIGYHPYQKLYSDTTISGIESRLRDVYSTHSTRIATIRSMISAAGRDPNSVELIASETNVSDYTSNANANEAKMAHALGTVEEVFSFAQLGVTDAHYWLWPGDPYDYTEFPVYKAYEGLCDHMGDTLLSTYSNNNTRLYTTRDSGTGEIAVWGLNFSNTADAALQLALTNLAPAGYDAQLMTLKAINGPTTLDSANLPSYEPYNGGPIQVDWQTTSLAGANLANYTMTLPAATISVLVLTPIPVEGDYNNNGIVDAADYVLWRKTNNTPGNYTYWRTRFGNTTNPGAGGNATDFTNVPEPTTLAILLTLLTAILSLRFIPLPSMGRAGEG